MTVNVTSLEQVLPFAVPPKLKELLCSPTAARALDKGVRQDCPSASCSSLHPRSVVSTTSA